MIEIKAELQGADTSARGFVLYQLALEKRMVEAVRDATKVYQQSVKDTELSGWVVNSRSGNLKSSVIRRVKEQKGSVVGSVWPRAKYGWMLGHGTPKNEVNVRPHSRHVEGAGASVVEYTELRRRRGRGKAKMKIHHMSVRASSVLVKGFVRKMLLARIAKPFMGLAYGRMRGIIEKKLRSAAYLAREDMLAGLESGTSPIGQYMDQS
jgi:hypothetical protein